MVTKEDLSSQGNIWSAAFSICKSCWRTVLLVVVAQFLLVAAKEITQKNDLGSGVPETIMYGALLFVSAQFIISDPSVRGDKQLSKLRVTMWIKLYLLELISTVPLVFVWAPILVHFSVQKNSFLYVVGTLAISNFFGLFVFGIWGTWPIAPVNGGDKTLAAAGVRGIKTLAYSLSRLVAGYLIVTIAGYVVIFLASEYMQDTNILGQDYMPNIAPSLVYLMTTFLDTLAVVLGSVVVVRSLLKSDKSGEFDPVKTLTSSHSPLVPARRG